MTRYFEHQPEPGLRALEILRCKRALTVDMIGKLSKVWGVPADVLVRPYRLAV